MGSYHIFVLRYWEKFQNCDSSPENCKLYYQWYRLGGWAEKAGILRIFDLPFWIYKKKFEFARGFWARIRFSRDVFGISEKFPDLFLVLNLWNRWINSLICWEIFPIFKKKIFNSARRSDIIIFLFYSTIAEKNGKNTK